MLHELLWLSFLSPLLFSSLPSPPLPSPLLPSPLLLIIPAELYENLGQVGASIKQHLVDGMRNMWQQLNEIARSHTSLSAEKDQPDTPQGTSQHHT